MAADQRKLLEQLMGGSYNSPIPGFAPKQLDITDPKVCHSYLCGECPHDLFNNTKNDLGPCSKTHVPSLKEEFMNASDEQKRQWGFEWDYKYDITRYIGDCDQKISSSQKRLEKTPEEIRRTSSLVRQIYELEQSIECGLAEIEALAELGSVNTAYLEHCKIVVQKTQKAQLERELKNLSDTSGPSGHQKLQVCDVCGAYLSRLDNDRRLADHFYGKMHLGYAKMRKELQRLNTDLKGRPPPRSYHRDDYDDRGRGGGYDGGYGGGGGYGGRGGRGPRGPRGGGRGGYSGGRSGPYG